MVLVNALLQSYRDDVDPGVHNAAEWSLGRLEADSQLEDARTELAAWGMRAGFGWYVTKSRITMTIFERPGAVRLGSPLTEPARDSRDETPWTCDLHWSFAVSTTEISQSQFHEICPDYDKYLNEHAPTVTCPANAVTWLDAVRYCRLLSERDGMPDSEMVIPPADDLRRGDYANFITHSGYDRRSRPNGKWLAARALPHLAFLEALQIYFPNTAVTLPTPVGGPGPSPAGCPTVRGCSIC